MSYLISIETTGAFLGVALYSFERAEKKFSHEDSLFTKQPMKQSELLIPALKKILKKNSLQPREVTLLAVDKGPGSFTGVRVGVSAARALAQGLRCPLIGVSSLEAMAYEEARRSPQIRRVLVVTLPALAEEIYGAVFEWDGDELRTLKAPAWEPKKVFASHVAALKRRKKSRRFVDVQRPPHPRALAELALRKFFAAGNKTPFHYEQVQPLYLQPTWAERCSSSAR